MVQHEVEMAWLHQALVFLVARYGKRGAARMLRVTRPTLEEWSHRITPTPRMKEAVEQAVREMGELPESALAERVEEIAEEVAALACHLADLGGRLDALETQQTAVVPVIVAAEAPGPQQPLRRWIRGLFGRDTS